MHDEGVKKENYIKYILLELYQSAQNQYVGLCRESKNEKKISKRANKETMCFCLCHNFYYFFNRESDNI